jgi:hypothetical protein
MKTWWAFIIVCVAALLLYLSTAAPSLTWAHTGTDGGDLISAAITNGVAHPPGYPTYVTIGQLLLQLPSGDVAYRFTLLSVVSMALAAGFTTLSILVLSRQPLIAVLAGLFFVTAPMVWGQATIAEVYALNAAFVAMIVYLVTPAVFRRETISLFRLTLAAWLWGLACGNSLTIAALAPLMLVAWWRSRKSKAWLPLLAFAIGLSVYLLIPLRALAQPAINWGDASTPDRFFALISAEMYLGYALGTTPQEFLTRLIAFAQLLVAQYGWLGVVLGLLGVYHALITPNPTWRWLALTIGFYLIFALGYSTPDSALYLIPIWMFGAWAIARGLLSVTEWLNAYLSSAVKRRFISQIVLLLIFLAGPWLTVITQYPRMNLHDDYTAVEFANRILTSAPPGALVITGNDGHTFALWYHRVAAGSRPDLAIVDRRLAGYEWYAAMLHAQGSAPQLPAYDPPETWLTRLATLNVGRTLCVVDETTAVLTCY